MAGRSSLLFRGSWFLRARWIGLRRRAQQRLADWRGAASAERARARWNPSGFAEALPDLIWTRSSVVREHLHEMVSGDPRCDWVTWMLHRYAVGTGLKALVLGCGEGWLERALARDARISEIVAVDFSKEMLARASRQAEREGLEGKIRYAAVDLDREILPGGPYDLILAHDAIHHVRDLEGFFDRVGSALATTGVFLFCDYVGPRRFDYAAPRRAVVDEFLRALPEKYRRLARTGGTATQGVRTDPGELARQDPSEAVRSDEILPLLRAKMKVLEEIPYGGSLLSPLLYEIIGNFEEGNEADEAILRQLCAAEKVLIQTRALPSDYMVVAATKR